MYPVNCPTQRYLISLGVGLLMICFGAGVSYGQLQTPSVSGEDGAQTGTENPREPVEAPNLRQLIEASAQLSNDLAAMDTQIAPVSHTDENRRDLQRIAQALDEIAQRLESSKKDGDSRYRLLNRFQARLDIQEEQLDKVIASAGSALDQAQDWIDKWGKAEKKWNRWQKAASDSLAYSVMQATFKQTQDTITRAKQRLTGNIQPIIALQNTAWRLRSRIGALKRQIVQTTSVIHGNILQGTSPPLFSPRFFHQYQDRLFDRLRQGVRAAPLPKRQFYKQRAWLVGLQILLVLAIAAYFRKNPKLAEESQLWTIFARRYIATGVFVSFFFLSFIYDTVPVLVDLIIRTAVAVGTVRLVASLFDDRALRRLLYVLVALFIATSIFNFITLPAPFFRLYVMAAAITGGVLAFQQSMRFRKKQSGSGAIWGFRVTALAFAVVLFLEVFGYSQLARYLFESIIQTLSLILVAWILILFLRGCLEIGVNSRPLQKFAVIARNTKAIQSKATVVVSTLVIALLIAEVLTRWKVFASAGAAVAEFLALGFTIGSKNITLGLVLAAGVVLYGSFLVSWSIQASMLEGAFSRRQVERGVRVAISKLIHYAVVLIGILLALSTMGFELKNLTIIGGALGVGIGFGMQTIVNNFICGLIMLFERPVKVGDTIEVEGTYGVVKQVGLRATFVETYDQAEIVVPNTDLITEQVTNWTLAERRLRLKIPVGAAYGSDVGRVKETLRACARNNPLVLDEPEPNVLFMGFGDSALNFELLCWTDDFDNRLQVISELNQEIEKRFREHDIEIPFPQRDLHLREADVKFPGSPSNQQHDSGGSGNEAQPDSEDRPARSSQERYP